MASSAAAIIQAGSPPMKRADSKTTLYEEEEKEEEGADAVAAAVGLNGTSSYPPDDKVELQEMWIESPLAPAEPSLKRNGTGYSIDQEFDPNDLQLRSSDEHSDGTLDGTSGGTSRTKRKDAGEEKRSPWAMILAVIVHWFAALQLAFGYITADLRKQKRSLAIGLTTVFLVVCFLSLIQNALARSAVVFIKLSEEQVGQYDVVFTPAITNTSTSYFLNYTYMNISLTGSPSIYGVAPRWLVPVLMTSAMPAPPQPAGNASSASWTATATATRTRTVTPTPSPRPSFSFSLDASTSSVTNSSVTIMVIDTDLESSIGLGTSWTHRALGQGEVHVTSSTLRALGLEPNAGNRVNIIVDANALLQQFTGGSSLLPANLLTNFLATANLSAILIPIPTFPNVPDVNVTIPGFSYLNITVNSTVIDLGSYLSQLNSTEVSLGTLIDFVNNEVYNGTSELDALVLILQTALQNSDVVLFDQEFTVIDGIDDPEGKYPQALGNVAIMEKLYFEDIIKNYLRDILEIPLFASIVGPQLDSTLERIEQSNLDAYAMTVIGMFCNRVEIYTQSTSDQQLSLIAATDTAAEALGIYFKATWSFPVAVGVQATATIKMFLDQIFFAVNGVLVILSVLLIYSLLLSDVEEKTFEYGMLRTLGMQQNVLILLLVLQSVFFSAPGIIFGFLCCFILYIFMDLFVSMFVVIPMDPTLNSSAITIGLVLGILLPVAGMILPIRRALTQTLRDALDVYHNIANNSIVTIRRLENLGVSLTETVLAIALVVIGFLIYYLAPLAFIYNNLEMFLNILTVILLGMVVGQVLIAQVFDIYIERALLFVLMWGPDRVLRSVVKKSLFAHRSRNRKTGMMFTLCIGFVIFAAVMFQQQADSIPQNLEWVAGADVVVSSSDINYPLPRDELSTILDTFTVGAIATSPSLVAYQVVQAYTFMSFPITSFPQVSGSYVGGLASIRARSVVLQAVDDDYLQAASTDYYIVSQLASDVSFPDVPGTGFVDVVAPLNQTFGYMATSGLPDLSGYVPPLVVIADPGSYAVNQTIDLEETTAEFYSEYIPILMSQSMSTGAYCDTTTPMYLQLNIGVRNFTGSDYYLLKPIAMLKKFPGFASINPITVSATSVIISMSMMTKIIQGAYGVLPGVPPQYNMTTPPLSSLLISITPDATLEQIEGVVNAVNSVLASIPNVGLVNVRAQVAQTALASSIILMFFDIVAIIGVIFCFFVLWLSFTANVRENSWEFGVLRAIGLDAATVMRLYIYEAIALVLACIILGTILGVITGSLLTLQLNLFYQNPFSLVFPVPLYILVVVLSLFVAVLGSYAPAAELKKLEVAIALKGA